MKQLLVGLLMALTTTSAFAKQISSRIPDATVQSAACCSWLEDKRWCMKGCLQPDDSAKPFAREAGTTTIEKILLAKPNGEEVESAICCSWTTTNTNCVPTCLIEDGKMIPVGHAPPEDLPDDEFCKRFPGHNFCGGR
jgi:hypothetical protein